jgi:hypothetical protein
MRVASGVAPRTWLYALVALTLAFKLWLSAVFPVTGDEAYFIDWGLRPAPGYYDHPPMVGWWLALLTQVSQAPWLLRLPATLMPAAMALTLYWALRRTDEDKAALAAIGLLLVPIHVWNVFITTDTPLVFFSFLSGLAYWRASRPGASHAWHLLAGMFLGLACLSKYFAVLLGLSYLVHAVLAGERRHRVGFLMACTAALPFVGFNLYWNYGNCWANFMFNLYNRHGGAGLSWRNPLLFVAMLLYVLPVPALLAGLKARAWGGRRGDGQILLLLVLAIFPWLLFALLSTVRQVGLHWVLSFVPFFFAAAALLLDRQSLRRTALFAGVFSLVHVVLIAVAAALPLERWQGSRLYDGIVFHFRMDDVLKALSSHEAGFEIAADGYSAAATLSYYRGRPVFVFGEASSHARHDDLMTDFRSLAGRNIAVLRKTPPAEADYQPYFASVEYQSFTIAGAQFHLVLGRQFDYPAYRDRILAQARDRYYRIPSYLPQGGCRFCERYFSSYCPIR